MLGVIKEGRVWEGGGERAVLKICHIFQLCKTERERREGRRHETAILETKTRKEKKKAKEANEPGSKEEKTAADFKPVNPTCRRRPCGRLEERDRPI